MFLDRVELVVDSILFGNNFIALHSMPLFLGSLFGVVKYDCDVLMPIEMNHLVSVELSDLCRELLTHEAVDHPQFVSFRHCGNGGIHGVFWTFVWRLHPAPPPPDGQAAAVLRLAS